MIKQTMKVVFTINVKIVKLNYVLVVMLME